MSEVAADARAVAERYIEAYESVDFDRVGTFWAADGVFIDPTSLGQSNGGYHFVGRDAIITGLKSAFDNEQFQVEEVEYLDPSIFEEGGHVVVSGKVRVTFRTKPDERLQRYTVQATTILHARDGKVVEHRDYADYSEAQYEQLP